MPQTVIPRSRAASTSIDALRIPVVTSSFRFGSRSSTSRGNGVRSRMATTTANGVSSSVGTWSRKTVRSTGSRSQSPWASATPW